MNWEQKKQLTELLIKCPSVNRASARDFIVNELSFGVHIRRNDAVWDDVLNIVSTSDIYPDGLDSFLDLVRSFEGNSYPMQAVDKFIADLKSQKYSSSEEQLDVSKASPREDVSSPKKSSMKDVLLKDRYRIYAQEHGHESTYFALDSQQGKRVVLQSTPYSEYRPLFEETAQQLADNPHSHLSQVYDHFTIQDGDYQGQYLVTEFLEEKTLGELSQERFLSEREALIYIIQVCEAIQHLHQQAPPILHLNIAPNHIRIHQGKAVLTHLERATIYNDAPDQIESNTNSSNITMNPGYTPIEQYGSLDDASEVSDIYALGATFYTLLTRQQPPDSFERLTGEAQYTPPNKINKDVRHQICQAIESAMNIEKRMRPQSIAEWLQTLRNILYQDIEKYLARCELLQIALEAGQWREADQETTKIIHTIIEEQRQPGAEKSNFPDAAIEVINELWETYSSGRYGLRIQGQIWQAIIEGASSERRQFRNFGEQVGWYEDGDWLDYSNLIFTPNACLGHLPSFQNPDDRDPSTPTRWRENVKKIVSRSVEYLIN